MKKKNSMHIMGRGCQKIKLMFTVECMIVREWAGLHMHVHVHVYVHVADMHVYVHVAARR